MKSGRDLGCKPIHGDRGGEKKHGKIDALQKKNKAKQEGPMKEPRKMKKNFAGWPYGSGGRVSTLHFALNLEMRSGRRRKYPAVSWSWQGD